MRKIVVFFQNKDDAYRAGEALTTENLADYSLTELSNDYEQQIRQEVFLRPKERNFIVIGALLGSIVLGTLFYLFSSEGSFGILMARWMAGGQPAAVFTGAGIGFAFGALLAGLYALSLPLEKDFTGYWMVSLYTGGPNRGKKAVEIIKSHFGLFV